MHHLFASRLNYNAPTLQQQKSRLTKRFDQLKNYRNRIAVQVWEIEISPTNPTTTMGHGLINPKHAGIIEHLALVTLNAKAHVIFWSLKKLTSDQRSLASNIIDVERPTLMRQQTLIQPIIFEPQTNEEYLIDSGAGIVLPFAFIKSKSKPKSSPVELYRMNIDLRLQRCFDWTLVVADVESHI